MKEVSNDCESTTCGSAKLPGWESWKTLVSVTAYHSFAGEVEASNTPTIRRLIPSCRHQLWPIALRPLADSNPATNDGNRPAPACAYIPSRQAIVHTS